MKKLLISASTLASATTLACAAQAADVVPAGYDWTGFYAGVNAGVAWNNSTVDQNLRIDLNTDVNNVKDQIEGNQSAFTGGGIIGYNYQIDKIVLGVEADINYLGFSDETSRSHRLGKVSDTSPTDIKTPMRHCCGSPDDNYAGLSTTSSLSFEGDWYGTLRGRLGYAADNLLFYGTGGLAYGHMSAKSDVKAKYGPDEVTWEGSADSTNWGWTIGAGMEYGIDNWSLGVEYLFVDLGSAEWDADHSGPLADFALDADAKGSVDYQFSVVRATAKLRF